MSTTDKNKLEILKILIELSEKESDRSWVRYSMMLYASTALLAILSLTIGSGLFVVALVPSVLGIAFSIAWLKINSASYYYEHRWHADMEKLIESDEILAEWVRGRNKPRISRPFKGRSGLFYFNIVPKAFLVLWTVVIVVAILGEVWEPLGKVLHSFGNPASAK